jgi:uncharacterized BrkB/YihY/UPF0761 family membrane protein
MLWIFLYFAIALFGAVLTVLLWNRNKSYHCFMVRKLNQSDDEYDRIYGNCN